MTKKLTSWPIVHSVVRVSVITVYEVGNLESIETEEVTWMVMKHCRLEPIT